MNEEKIEILRQQAKAYMMIAKALKGKENQRMYLLSGIACVKMMITLKNRQSKELTKTFKLKLVA